MDKLRVKPLEWEYFGDRAAKANAMLLTNYLIDRWSDGRFEVSVSSPGYGTGFDGKRWHGSMNEAKAAAQADYEARILAALEPVTVQEAARVLLAKWRDGEFEDSADAIADDAITDQWAHVDRTYPDANPIIEAWLRAIAEGKK